MHELLASTEVVERTKTVFFWMALGSGGFLTGLHDKSADVNDSDKNQLISDFQLMDMNW